MTQRRVLFLCTHNSARSQMAEGLLRNRSGSDFEVHSAGIITSEVRPEAVHVMDELNIDISNQISKTLEPFINQHFEYVITVCDSANEQCPIFPNANSRLHWSIDDPSSVKGDDEIRLKAFRTARDELARQVDETFNQSIGSDN